MKHILLDFKKSLLYFFGCFGPITSVWQAKLIYDAKFQEPNDVLHLLLEVVQISVLALAVLHIRPVSYMSQVSANPEIFCFCLAISMNTFITILKEMEIRFWGVKGQTSARYGSMTTIISYLPSFIILLIATIYSGTAYFNENSYAYPNYRFLESPIADDSVKKTAEADHVPIILLLCAYITRSILFYPLSRLRGKGANFKQHQVPVNVDYIIHRNGEWTMLMLGRYQNILTFEIVDCIDSSSLYCILSYVMQRGEYFKFIDC